MQSIEQKIVNRIYAGRRGTVFTLDSFLDLGSRSAVGIAVFRLTKRGMLERLGAGVYLYPRIHPKLGRLDPTTEDIIKALRKATREEFQPSGAYAANLLGLSEQVPMRIVLLTAGDSRKIKIGEREIIMRRTTPKNMATAGRISGLVIQAFKYLGRQGVEDWMIKHLRDSLPIDQRHRLFRDIRLAPAWIAEHIREITKE